MIGRVVDAREGKVSRDWEVNFVDWVYENQVLCSTGKVGVSMNCMYFAFAEYLSLSVLVVCVVVPNYCT